MIKINLLPVKQARKREYGRQQLLLFFVLVAAEVGLLYLVLSSKEDELTQIHNAVEATRAEIAQIGQLDQRINTLEAERDELISVREMMEGLQANRIGPGGVLEELKYVLNVPGSQREAEEQQELREWNTSMDPRQVWLESLSIDPATFRLRGVARSGEAVAEFLLRMTSSRPAEDPFFVEPDLSSYAATNDPYYGEVMSFSISGGVRYHPMILGN